MSKFFDSDFKRKAAVLDPKFKKQLEGLFKNIHKSVSVLYEAATRDEKTGLYNTEFFNTLFAMEVDKAKRGQKLSLIVIDIDFFKKLNDKYGHLRGDYILKKLANVLIKKTRKSDIVSRFGGEEFFVLLPSTNLKKAERVARRIHRAVHLDSILKKYSLTVSQGITEFRKSDTKQKFKQRADKAVFKAKKQGRDRFVSL